MRQNLLAMLVLASLVAAPLVAQAQDSSSVVPDPIQNLNVIKKPYILMSGNDLFVPTWYYGAPNTLLGQSQQKCKAGYYPHVVFSVYGTPNSDSVKGGCGTLYGINDQSYFSENGTGYQVWGRAHLRYSSHCPDQGLYVSYILYCEPSLKLPPPKA